MANFYTSPNMNLTIPVPTLQTGPNWSFNLNSSLTLVDTHNHTSGKGVQIPTTGLNINADLPINGFNLTTIRSSRYSVQSGAISDVTDLSCVYAAGTDGDLYFNDGNGNQIRITQSGSVAGSSGTITGLPSGTASAAYSAVAGTFVFQQATSTAANLDIGTLVVRYPGSYPSPSGNAILLEAPSTISSQYPLVLPALPSYKSYLTLDTSGNIVGSVNATPSIAPITFTSTGVGSPVVVATITLSCSGNRMVRISAVSPTPPSEGAIEVSGAAGVHGARFTLTRVTDSTDIAITDLVFTGSVDIIIPLVLEFIDDSPLAGSVTYSLTMDATGSSSTATITSGKLIAMEI